MKFALHDGVDAFVNVPKANPRRGPAVGWASHEPSDAAQIGSSPPGKVNAWGLPFLSPLTSNDPQRDVRPPSASSLFGCSTTVCVAALPACAPYPRLSELQHDCL